MVLQTYSKCYRLLISLIGLCMHLQEPKMTTTELPREQQLTEDMTFGSIHKLCIATYCVLMTVSAIGNITVLVNILKRRRNLRFGNNYMFMHLAIADLLLRNCVHQSGPLFRHSKAHVERRQRRQTQQSNADHCLVFIFHVQQHPVFTWYEQCLDFDMFPTQLYQFWYRILNMVLVYGFPLLVIFISYACILTEIFRRYQLSSDENFRRSSLVFLNRAKNRTLKMAIIIFVVFFICWTPYYVMYWIDQQSAEKVDLRVRKGLFLFACTNSCMNPIVYGYFNFRSGRGSGYGATRPGQQLQHHQITALSNNSTGVNSRRGSNCSSIYRDNSNQSMSWNRRNSHETEMHANNNRDENHLHPNSAANHNLRTTVSTVSEVPEAR
ncbi:hypothetical protein C0J52_03123 [Blattella germanica]|nr:hypothetical protein C0J52_03123 [Blattella germanica]